MKGLSTGKAVQVEIFSSITFKPISIKVTVIGVTAEDGSRRNWLIKGNIHKGYVSEEEKPFKAFYSTERKTGRLNEEVMKL